MKASDNVAALLWAFGDEPRRADVRNLAQEVRFLEAVQEQNGLLYRAAHRALDELVQLGGNAAIVAQLAAALGVTMPPGNADDKGSP